MAFDRVHFANAIVCYARENETIRARLERCIHTDCRETPVLAQVCRARHSRVIGLADVSIYRYSGDRYSDVMALEPEARAVYVALVAKHEGEDEARELAEDIERIQSPGGVEIRVSCSDDDPFMIDFTVSDRIAEAWADAHGSLAGGTWEGDGSGDLVYDSACWHDKLFAELQADGYILDFSDYTGEPDEDDHKVLRHWQDCAECECYDFRTACEHMERGQAPVPREQLNLFRKGVR